MHWAGCAGELEPQRSIGHEPSVYQSYAAVTFSCHWHAVPALEGLFSQKPLRGMRGCSACVPGPGPAAARHACRTRGAASSFRVRVPQGPRGTTTQPARCPARAPGRVRPDADGWAGPFRFGKNISIPSPESLATRTPSPSEEVTVFRKDFFLWGLHLCSHRGSIQ